MPTLQFLGAAGTVTGSKYLLTSGNQKILIDCGLFQGKNLKDRNWQPLPVAATEISAILITHAHLDHTGYLPKMIELGFHGKIYATPPTVDLLPILLLDSAHLQEEEASYHRDEEQCCAHAKPLYTVQEASQAIHQLSPVKYGQVLDLGNFTAEFIPAGHILGSAFIRVTVREENSKTTILFTGDMGRYDSPIIDDPTSIPEADFVLLESTYGNRAHEQISREDALLPAIQSCVKRSGCLLMPAFTLGRTQEILYTIRQLLIDKKMAPIPVFVDSPMAIDITHIYETHHEEHDLNMEKMEKAGLSPFHIPSVKYVRTVTESKTLNNMKGPMIIVSANGMATGGRIMHHLVHRLPDPNTILMFVGYQAEGTRGRELVEGAKSVKIFHQDIPVKATVMQADNFSAHGDYNEIVRWLGGFTKPPSTLFLVHGEDDARTALQGHIRDKFPNWKIELPNELETRDLSVLLGARS